ncbi:CAP domain-containing protein [Azoarcus sp. PA01]|nr:CAP domain-containing protein [Azoarcus sp. PA01]
MTRLLVAILAGPALGFAAADVEETASEIVARTNVFREAQPLAPLERDAALGRTARDFARFMANTGRYGHTADGRRPAQRAQAEGYEYCIVAENIGYQYRSDGFGSSAELAEAFVEGGKNSPEHRENMLEPAVTQTGVGVAQGEDGRFFGVQMFGRPKSASIRFEVQNRSAGLVAYRTGERDFSLRPRELRTHRTCRPGRLSIACPAGDAPFTADIDDGTRYIVRDDGVVMQPASAQ